MNHESSLKPVLDFLGDLRLNNNRAWFELNRAAYETAKECFEEYVDDLIGNMMRFDDLAGTTAKECIQRIYRDIRFSKDKSPYKTSMSASIAPGGWKSPRQGYYLHLEPHGASMLAGGLYMPTPQQLTRFRQAIDRDARPLRAIISHKDFKRQFGTITGERLKTAPQGYSREHSEIDWLQLKQVTVVHRLTDEIVLSPKFADHTIAVFTVMKPFLDYLNEILL